MRSCHSAVDPEDHPAQILLSAAIIAELAQISTRPHVLATLSQVRRWVVALMKTDLAAITTGSRRSQVNLQPYDLIGTGNSSHLPRAVKAYWKLKH